MKSPFAIFRKYQKASMAFVTLLSMIAFVFLGTVGRNSGGSSRASETVVQLNTGGLDVAEFQQLMYRRERANQFVQRAFFDALGSDMLDQARTNPMLMRQIQQQSQQFLLRLDPNPRQDVLLHYLLRLEAQRIGIVITDQAVEDFIDQITNKRLSSDQFRKIVADLHASPKELFDCLRDELQARMAYVMEEPRDPQSPDEYWKFYRQLKVENTIEVAGVPVKQFVAEVPDPAEDKLKAYFEKYKDNYPDMTTGFHPGFKQPRRVRLQMLEAKYETAEKLVQPVTAEEVKDYYEQNKDQLFLNFASDPNSKPLDPVLSPDDDTASPGGTEPNTNNGPAGAGEEKQPAAGADDKPAGKNETPKSPESPAATEPAAPQEPAKPEKKEPEKKESDKDQAATKGADSPAERNLAARVVLQQILSESNPGRAASDQSALALQGDADTEKPAKPAADKPESAAEPAKQGEPADGEKKDGEKKEDAAAETPKYRPLDDALQTEIRERILRERVIEELKDKIGDEALDKLGEFGQQFNAPRAVEGSKLFVDFNGNGKWEEGEPSIQVKGTVQPEALSPEQNAALQAEVAKLAAAEVKQIAEKLKLEYFQTELVSPQELSELPGIGRAYDANSSTEMGSATTVIDQVFSDETLFRPMLALDPETQNLYIYWKAEDLAAHVPHFSDPGIKALVLSTWKTQEAQTLAEKRAQALAEMAREKKLPMVEALDGVTVTGAKDGISVQVLMTPSFTWMHESAAPSNNPFAPKPPPEISVLPTVENAGDEFMRTVFDVLQPGEIGVAANRDRSVYYVVRIVKRIPSTPEGMEEMREKFFRSELFGMNFGSGYQISSPYQDLARRRQYELAIDWMKGLEKRYAVRWLKPDDADRFQSREFD